MLGIVALTKSAGQFTSQMTLVNSLRVDAVTLRQILASLLGDRNDFAAFQIVPASCEH